MRNACWRIALGILTVAIVTLTATANARCELHGTMDAGTDRSTYYLGDTITVNVSVVNDGTWWWSVPKSWQWCIQKSTSTTCYEHSDVVDVGETRTDARTLEATPTGPLTLTVSAECYFSAIGGSTKAQMEYSPKSLAVTVYPTAVPDISPDPVSQTVLLGQSVAFTVGATGGPPPTLQWQKLPLGGAWTDIAGAVGPTYSTGPLGLADTGTQYRCRATNRVGSHISEAATVTVCAAPEIRPDPVNQTVAAGQTATFSVGVTGNPSPTLQWQKKPVGGSWSDISGATGLSYTTGTITLADSGTQYRCLATNFLGSRTSEPATLTVVVLPDIAPDPVSTTVPAGGSTTFTVGVTGVPEPSIHWEYSTNGGINWMDVDPPATGLSYTTPPSGICSSGTRYRCVAVSVAGSHTSEPATLTVPVVPTHSIGEARRLPDGVECTVEGVVTGAFEGYSYIQSRNRASGIKVVTTKPVSVADQVAVQGVLDTEAEERVLLAICVAVSNKDGVVLSDDFERTPGAVGGDISGRGWTRHGADGPATISSTTIDRELSVRNDSPTGWAQYYQNLAPSVKHVLQPGEVVEMTWVSRITGETDNTAGMELTDSTGKKYWECLPRFNNGLREFYLWAGSAPNYGTVPMPTSLGDTIDIKASVTRESSSFFYRNHGDTDWVPIPTSLNAGAGDSVIDQVWLGIYKNAWVDSVYVSSCTPPGSVTTMFEEDFGSLGGGWKQHGVDGPASISMTSIDSGYSLMNESPTGWAQYYQDLPAPQIRILQPGEAMEMTWVARLTSGVNSGCSAELADRVNKKYWQCLPRYVNGSREFYLCAGTASDYAIVPMPSGVSDTIDIRVRLTRDASIFYYRNHGQEQWTQIPTPLKTGAGDCLINQVWLGMCGAAGATWMDSIAVRRLTSPTPLGMVGRSLGNALLGVKGLDSTGLLVRTAGRVTYLDPAEAFAYVDDGSGRSDGNTLSDDGSSVKGIRVVLPAGAALPTAIVGNCASITGISGGEMVDGIAVSVLRVREQSDIALPSETVLYEEHFDGKAGQKLVANLGWAVRPGGYYELGDIEITNLTSLNGPAADTSTATSGYITGLWKGYARSSSPGVISFSCLQDASQHNSAIGLGDSAGNLVAAWTPILRDDDRWMFCTGTDFGNAAVFFPAADHKGAVRVEVTLDEPGKRVRGVIHKAGVPWLSTGWISMSGDPLAYSVIELTDARTAYEDPNRPGNDFDDLRVVTLERAE